MASLRSTKPDGFWANHLSPQLNQLWRGRWRPGFVEPARYLYDHELVLVTEGACVVQIGDASHELRAGQYVIIPPDTYHVTTTKRGVYRNCIHFDWRETPAKKPHTLCCYYPERPKPSAVTPCPAFVPRRSFAGDFRHTAAIFSLIETLFHRWQSGEQVAQALSRATFMELIVLLMNPPGLKARPSHQGFEHACAVRDLLDQQSESTDGIQDLLGTLGFSYPHLCRLFRTAFGITPIEYRNALRLERAKALLLNPKLTIAEVAYAVGFRDAGYFSRQFRKQNGASPRELRQGSMTL
jgi:AraC-like DNA-binding protein